MNEVYKRSEEEEAEMKKKEVTITIRSSHAGWKRAGVIHRTSGGQESRACARPNPSASWQGGCHQLRNR